MPQAKSGQAMSKSSLNRNFKQSRRLVPCLLAASVALLMSAGWSQVRADDSVSGSLAKLEDKFFQHDFSKDEVGDRIERLEKLVYGEARTGSTDERLKTLMTLIPASTPADNAAAQPDASKSTASAPPPEARRPMRKAEPVADTSADPVQNENSYPAITALEKKLLNRDYVGETVGKRLDRLEIKAYGKTSASDDFQDRVDRLKASTGVDVARSKPVNSEWADEEEEKEPVAAGSQGVTPFTGIGGDDPSSQRNYRKQQQSSYGRPRPSNDPYAGTGTFGAGGGGGGYHSAGGGGSFGQGLGSSGGGRFADAGAGSAGGGLPAPAPDYSRGTPQSAQIPAPTMGVSQQISLLEREVFKKTYEKETILNRLSRLESTVFPQDKPSSDKSLPERMNRLIVAVPVSQASADPAAAPSPKKRRGGDPDFPDLDFGGPSLTSQQAQQAATRGPSGLSKIINGLGGALGGGYTGSYAASPGHLVTDPSTGLLYDQYTGTLIDPMTGAVVGRRQVQMGGYPAYGGFNSGMSPYGGMGGMGGGMGGGSGMGFGFGGGGMRMGGWP